MKLRDFVRDKSYVYLEAKFNCTLEAINTWLNCEIMITLMYNKQLPKKHLFILLLFCSTIDVFSQKSVADSLSKELEREKIDTNKVTLMWQIADATYKDNPDTALQIAQNALYLAKSVNYTEGQSRSLGILANAFMMIGNYPRALELNFQKLQLEEKRNRPRNLASVLMNIGIIYRFQEEYSNALYYYSKADSVIRKNNVEVFKCNIALNIGDAYDRLEVFDSAHKYYNISLEIAQQLKNSDYIGLAMTGLGHSYRKTGGNNESLTNYRSAIKYLQEANDDETLCEATIGLATLFQQLDQTDSAGYYANVSISIAKKDGFLSSEYEAAEFLTNHYKKIGNIDSAFAYAEYSKRLNDSLNGKAKIRQLQLLSSNEQFRQRELEENKQLTAKRRHQQLQLLLIGIFIPGLFLITLMLSRQKIHIRVIKVLGILSLLFFFEYLTLWLHPTVAELTGHKPIFEILIFVGIAAMLIPLHHRSENWLIDRLIRHRVFRGQTKKLHKPVHPE
jgi:tetratricopeptide (TPR) repeat protein